MPAGAPRILELPPPNPGVLNSLAHGVRPNVPGGGNPIVAGTDDSETPSEIFRECRWCQRLFWPRRRGGSPQQFCSKARQTTFYRAARKRVEVALAYGQLSVADLKPFARVPNGQPPHRTIWDDLTFSLLPYTGRTGYSDDGGSKALEPDGEGLNG